MNEEQFKDIDKLYLIHQTITTMDDQQFKKIEDLDGNTAKTVNRLPDDPSYVYDIFIPREYNIFPFPKRWPKSKKTRIMVGAMDSPFYDNWKKEGELINFDSFWLFESARELDVTEYNNASSDLKYLFTTMINRSKLHRRYLMKELDNFGLLYDKSEYSFLNPPKDENEVIWHKETEQKVLTSQEWILDDYNYEKPDFEWKPPIELKQSLLQIVGETIGGNEPLDPTFMTEKTWIPLLLGIPFVVVSSQNFHRDMYERFGIEMYDEIIDYHFDSVPEMQMRIHSLVKEINKLKHQNWHELRKRVSKKVKRNQEIVHKLITSADTVPNIESFDSEKWDWIVDEAQKRIKSGGFLKNLM
jgi:hypothetical protein|tara:strand:+ start:839 stop:1909 length:1071 start_codon:yes stop_codon:yes gene_type:complete